MNKLRRRKRKRQQRISSEKTLYFSQPIILKEYLEKYYPELLLVYERAKEFLKLPSDENILVKHDSLEGRRGYTVITYTQKTEGEPHLEKCLITFTDPKSMIHELIHCSFGLYSRDRIEHEIIASLFSDLILKYKYEPIDLIKLYRVLREKPDILLALLDNIVKEKYGLDGIHDFILYINGNLPQHIVPVYDYESGKISYEVLPEYDTNRMILDYLKILVNNIDREEVQELFRELSRIISSNVILS